MSFYFSNSPQEFGDSPLVPQAHPVSDQANQPVQSLPFDSEADAGEAAIAAFGMRSIQPNCEETPRLWGQLIEQADVCFEYAQLAEKSLRFSAACGLILTARELLRRSLCVDCSTTEHLALERAVIERMETSRRDLDRLLDLAVQVRLFAI